MLKCNGKTFMNLQEAVQWLLNNNALFFMCNEDYAADTEISLDELVNPSPANPKIGSLVLFADGKISPITGITDDSFTVGSDYTDIRFVKSVDHFSIDASQHLIVSYTDGTSEDLGPIFSGNVTISGNLNVTGMINGIQNPSVKPIYCHPIRFTIDGASGGQTLRCIKAPLIILNNSPEPIDTATKLKNYLYNQGQSLDIICCVDFYDSNGVYVGQLLKITGSESNIPVEWTRDGSTTTTAYLAPEVEFIVDSDTVNRIN